MVVPVQVLISDFQQFRQDLEEKHSLALKPESPVPADQTTVYQAGR
jgi:hypothetical protein